MISSSFIIDICFIRFLRNTLKRCCNVIAAYESDKISKLAVDVDI